MNRKFNRRIFEEDFDDTSDERSESQESNECYRKKPTIKPKVVPEKCKNICSTTKQGSTIKHVFHSLLTRKEEEKPIDIKKKTLTESEALLTKIQKINLSKNTEYIEPNRKNLCELIRERETCLEPLGLVVIGEVDSGKSTLIGQFLCQMGVIKSKHVEQLRQLAPKSVKAGDVYSWICDELEEERQRGMTLYVTTKTFDTESRHITLLDTPGHQELRQRMLKAAIIADVAVIVFPLKNSDSQVVIHSELERHIQLIYFLGIQSFIVVINKFDKVDWNEALYHAVVAAFKMLFKKLNIHLTHCQLIFVPVSALHRLNLVETPKNDDSLQDKVNWLQEGQIPTLLQAMNRISIVASKESQLQCENALIFSVMEAYQVNRNTHVSGRILQGSLTPKTCVTVLPLDVETTVLDMKNNEQVITVASSCCFVNSVALNTINVLPGSLLCHGQHNVLIADSFLVHLSVLNTDTAILPGFTCTLNLHLAEHVATIISLNVLLLRHNKQQNVANPRYLLAKDQAIVSVQCDEKDHQ
ncbi:uncharacterized protein LOC128884393 [Hylaeus volcanicus]|uniref:uncharacterized protein LOC128884393 n=1 Tax=Hylaeus volcanicus TaxID=313075 RepID=UPI0023B819F5|nr:uncharacterized protein LOC128884393 [Hylaeus volcanicus]